LVIFISVVNLLVVLSCVFRVHKFLLVDHCRWNGD